MSHNSRAEKWAISSPHVSEQRQAGDRMSVTLGKGSWFKRSRRMAAGHWSRYNSFNLSKGHTGIWLNTLSSALTGTGVSAHARLKCKHMWAYVSYRATAEKLIWNTLAFKHTTHITYFKGRIFPCVAPSLHFVVIIWLQSFWKLGLKWLSIKECSIE